MFFQGRDFCALLFRTVLNDCWLKPYKLKALAAVVMVRNVFGNSTNKLGGLAVALLGCCVCLGGWLVALVCMLGLETGYAWPVWMVG